MTLHRSAPWRLLALSLARTAHAQQRPPLLAVRLPAHAASPGRPIAPLHGARTASDRPRFRWEPPSRTASPTLEVSRTRNFTGEVIRAPATGDGGVLPDALAAGRWYWRLAPGGAPSMFVVRANHGSSDVSWGTEPDPDGDGESDVVFATMRSGELGGGAFPVSELDATNAMFSSRWFSPAGERWVALSSMGDLDGDGATDLFSLGVTDGRLATHFFSPRVGAVARPAWGLEPAGDVVVVSAFPVGDLDRDGRADLAGTLVHQRRVHPWIVTLSGQVVVLDPVDDATEGVQVVDAGDANADGYADVAFVGRRASSAHGCALWVPGSPGGVDTTRSRRLCATTDAEWRLVGPAAAGDFDGDGDADLAFAWRDQGSGRRRVAVFAGSTEPLAPEPIALFDAGPGSYGDALLFADADGDGRDELWIGDPDASRGRGRVTVVGRERPAVVLRGDDDSANFGSDLVNLGAASARGDARVATGRFPAPALNRRIGVMGGSPATLRASIVENTVAAAGVRVFAAVLPSAPTVVAEMDAVLARRPGAFEAMVRRRPRLAIALATIAASEAGDARAVIALDARQRGLAPDRYLSLEVEGAGPLARAFDALRVGLLSEVGDGYVTPPLAVCQAMMRHPAVALSRFDDRWGSGQSGPSEEVRDRCYEPLVRATLADPTRADAALDAADLLRFVHARVAPRPSPLTAGSIVNGFLMGGVDAVDGVLFGAMPGAPPGPERLAAADRRLNRAVAATRSILLGLDERVMAFRAGVDAVVFDAAAGACAMRRLRGLSADEDACRAWLGITVREALANWLTEAWGTPAEGQEGELSTDPVW